jgi:ubiquinone/menaquinone biosynthesis C-methylase UbiE
MYMKYNAAVVICCTLAGTLAVSAQVPHQHHPPADAAEYARILEDPSRDAWQKPHEVVEALSLNATDTVADIGAGSCYFARRFAHHARLVYAVDIDTKLLDICKKDAPENLKTVLADADDPKLPAGGVDLIFFCDVVHHLGGREAYFAKIKTALKPDGRVVVIDFHKRALPVGPDPAMKIERAEMIREFERAGFRLASEETFLPYQYFLTFAVAR